VLNGSDITFRIEILNNGPDTASDVRLEDELPEGVEFVSAEECSDFFRVVNCTLGSLTPGQSMDVSFTVQVSTTETSITNTFIVVGRVTR